MAQNSQHLPSLWPTMIDDPSKMPESWAPELTLLSVDSKKSLDICD